MGITILKCWITLIFIKIRKYFHVQLDAQKFITVMFPQQFHGCFDRFECTKEF